MSDPTAPRTVHLVVPPHLDDAHRTSGGNRYDRRLRDGLRAAGWQVRTHAAADRDRLRAALEQLPDGGVVMVDGLVCAHLPDVVVPAAHRLRLVVLLHMPFGERSPRAREAERTVLGSAAAVVTTSAWTRAWLVEHEGIAPERLQVAAPGVDPADPAERTPGGTNLLCVAAVVRDKGHDVFVDALGDLADHDWDCAWVGRLDREPAFVSGVRARAAIAGLAGRVRLSGPLTGSALEAAYRAADLLVLPTRRESYGMVVAEALAHGVPVVASDVGGVAEALGRAPDGSRPGLLVPPDDRGALRAALRSWLEDPALRSRLRASATARRATVRGWDATVADVVTVLAAAREEVAA